MKDILQYLKLNGELFDTEIAKATGLSLSNVRLQLSELAAKREVMVCHSIRVVQGNKVEGVLSRIAGYIPPASPGRKSKAQLKLSEPS